MANKQEDIIPGYMDDIDLGWLAGLWEGEGHFGYDRTQLAHLRSTDLDTILKMKNLIECTFNLKEPITLLKTESKRKNEQDTFGIQTYGAIARAIMRLLLPLMGNRRRGQIWRSLNEIRQQKLPPSVLKSLGLK